MPSVSVFLTDEEYRAVLKTAVSEKKSVNRVIAEVVRVAIREKAV